MTRPIRPTAWTRGEVWTALALVAVGFVVTWDAWRDIFWMARRDEEQSHVFLVPIIALWLMWIRRLRLRRCPRQRLWIGPAIVLVGWLLHSIGDLAHIEAFWHLGAITVVIGCFLSVAGDQYLWRLFPGFAVLAFMVPVPGVIRQRVALPLQRSTAEATQSVLDLLGIEAAREGSSLSINGMDILIAEACNGLRMVFALFLVSFVFAFSSPIRQPIRLLIIALSPITAILCNVVRLVPTVWIYGFVSTDAGEMIHDIGGWVMLPIAFLLLMGVFRLLRWALVPVYQYTLAYGK